MHVYTRGFRMISCANHDYVEIACMYRFVVKLVFKNGKVVEELVGLRQKEDYEDAVKNHLD